MGEIHMEHAVPDFPSLDHLRDLPGDRRPDIRRHLPLGELGNAVGEVHQIHRISYQVPPPAAIMFFVHESPSAIFADYNTRIIRTPNSDEEGSNLLAPPFTPASLAFEKLMGSGRGEGRIPAQGGLGL